MSRSADIYGRIRRKLGALADHRLVDDMIYDEMQEAQKQIFARVQFEREFELMLVEDIDTYPLSTGWNLGSNLHSQSNAAKPTSDADAVTGWTVSGGTVESVADPRAASSGDYALKYTVNSYLDGNLVYETISPASDRYTYVELWAKASKACTLNIYFSNDDEQKSEVFQFSVTTSYQKFYAYIPISGDANELKFYTDMQDSGDYLIWDDLTVISQNADNVLENYIGSIKNFLLPSTWNYDLEIVNNSEWDSIINTTYTIEQPLKATIFDNKLRLHPDPSTSGDILKLWCYLVGPETVISSSVNPETHPMFDKAIEYFVLSHLDDEKSRYYLELFENQVSTNSHIIHNKHHTQIHIEDNW